MTVQIFNNHPTFHPEERLVNSTYTGSGHRLIPWPLLYHRCGLYYHHCGLYSTLKATAYTITATAITTVASTITATAYTITASSFTFYKALHR